MAFDAFHKCSFTVDGYQSICKGCAKERHSKTYAENKERFRNKQYERKYNLSFSDVESLFKQQNGCCKICSSVLELDIQTKSSKSSGTFVDHCHTTGKVRGLLCYYCNIGLGMFKDNPTLLEKASVYLKD